MKRAGQFFALKKTSERVASCGNGIRTAVSALVGITCLACCAIAPAQSLWQNRVDRWENPIADVRAMRAGDLLVVTIQESSNVQNRDQRQMNKQNQSSTTATGNFDLSGVIGTASAGTDGDQETTATRRFGGDSQYRSERGFLDRFTVTVVDALPNGNLLVSGKRKIGLEGDARTLVLSGIVRAIDVSPDNTVPSSAVAQLEIRYESLPTSPEGAFVNQGWFAKKANRWWPF